jgi:hypothetical protein
MKVKRTNPPHPIAGGGGGGGDTGIDVDIGTADAEQMVEEDVMI